MVKTNVMRIPGSWREGYVLDYHTLGSDFLGYDEYGHPQFENHRSELGQLLYQLKYKSNKTVVDQIVETIVNFIIRWNKPLDFILPVPPSKYRPFQPVLEIAKGISFRTNILLCEDCIHKIKDTPELKNIYNYEERLKLLEDAYDLGEINMKNKNILLFDDLFRSGATLNAITDLLYDRADVANVYALAITRTRSNS